MTESIKEKQVRNTVFDSGFESLDEIINSFQSITTCSVHPSKNKITILLSQIATPIGSMFVCATTNGVCLVEFTDRKDIKGQFKRLEKLIDGEISIGENEHIIAVKEQLTQYFIGKRQLFELILDIPGTQFQQQVWQCLTNIDYGTTSSYQQQATDLQNPKAIRAMASANGRNRLAIIIPCHRVIGKDGSLTGYAGGLARKQWLLDHEQKYKC